MANKSYQKFSLKDSKHVFNGYIDDYEIPESVLVRLSKDLGLPLSLCTTLSDIGYEHSIDDLIHTQSVKKKMPEITILKDDMTKKILGYTYNPERPPVLNEDFIHRYESTLEMSKDIFTEVERYYLENDTKSTVLIKKVDPLTVRVGHSDGSIDEYSYEIGVYIINDELDTTYCRLAVFLDGNPIYLPATMYNLTASRYNKSTDSSKDALEVLLLRLQDDLRGEELLGKLTDFHTKYVWNTALQVSYEEYKRISTQVLKIPTTEGNKSYLESLSLTYEDFENRYSNIEERGSAYIWRCTAFIENGTIGALVYSILELLKSLGAPSDEYESIRYTLGEILSNKCIASEIAK